MKPTKRLEQAAMDSPVSPTERIWSIDVLRGFALLGILVPNLGDFADVSLLHSVPIGGSHDIFLSPHARFDMLAVFASWLFFEGKMRGIFGMLFGAGVLLFTRRSEQRGSQETGDTYDRRNMWLVLFGLLHATLIWSGDVLFAYGLTALLFLFPFRRLHARTLVCLGCSLFLVLGTLMFATHIGPVSDVRLERRVEHIEHGSRNSQNLTSDERATLKSWSELLRQKTPSAQLTAVEISEAQLPYTQGVAQRLQGQISHLGQLMIWILCDTLPIMLLGMGLMKLGFFSLELSPATYVRCALIGSAVSLSICATGLRTSYSAHFFFTATYEWLYWPYECMALSGTLGLSSILLLLVRYKALRTLQRGLAAVGRTAFSNYILTSLICQTIFLWSPHPLFGRLEYYQILLVAPFIWTVNVTLSVIWLRFFAFGPLEWVWRSLTYWKRQGLLLRS